MDYLSSYQLSCPYCGESYETTIDISLGSQSYFEDCYVCCRPIEFTLVIGHTGELEAVQVRRDDE